MPPEERKFLENLPLCVQIRKIVESFCLSACGSGGSSCTVRVSQGSPFGVSDVRRHVAVYLGAPRVLLSCIQCTAVYNPTQSVRYIST